jgi:hypothetical protein
MNINSLKRFINLPDEDTQDIYKIIIEDAEQDKSVCACPDLLEYQIQLLIEDGYTVKKGKKDRETQWYLISGW